jgi:hypothetical protein
MILNLDLSLGIVENKLDLIWSLGFAVGFFF